MHLFKTQNRGFSLLEIMIVAGMLGGLGLVVTSLTKQTTKSSSKYQFDSEINLITNEINAIISNPATCLTTFGANKLTPTNINSKYYTIASGTAPATGYGNASVQIASYTLAHSPSATASANDGILTIQFKNKAIAGGTTTPRTVNIYYEGAISAISNCRSLSTSTTDIWSHGTGNDIYYALGNVVVGDTAPVDQAYTLDVRGIIHTVSVVADSDIRLKKDIHPIESAAAGIYSLRGITYSWNDLALSRGITDVARQLGLVAQEVEKVFPEAVKNSADGSLSVNYSALVAPVIETLKDLHKENQAATKEVTRLRDENKNIKAWICHQDKNAPFCL